MKNAMRFFLITAFVFISFNTPAQKNNTNPKQDIERVLRNIAGNIIQNSTFRIVNTKTGETFNDSGKLTVEANYKVESPYNEWRYWNGVMNIGFIAMGKQLNDPQYIEYAKRNVDFVFDHDDFFKKQYDNRIRNTGMEQKFLMSLLDDCGAMAQAFWQLIKLTLRNDIGNILTGLPITL